MFTTPFQIVVGWAMSVMLLINSLIILLNIFDFPPTGMRHFISFLAAAGFVFALFFIVTTAWRFLSSSKWF